MVIIMALCLSCIAYIFIIEILDLLFAVKIRTLKRLLDTENMENLRSSEEKRDPVLKQIFKLLIDRILEFFELIIPKNETKSKQIESKLRKAGIKDTAEHYRAIVLFRMVGGSLILILYSVSSGEDPFTIGIYGIFGAVSGIILSRFFLSSKITARENEIYHDLPDAMDLLSVSVAAGLGFDQAMGYLIEKSSGALVDEFAITRKELALGKNRKNCFRDFAQRCGNLEIQTFVTAILQADETGASINNVLRVQAETIRETHKQNVEEKAQKLAIKMLIPMVIFIFPVIFIVLLGPAFMTMSETFGKI